MLEKESQRLARTGLNSNGTPITLVTKQIQNELAVEEPPPQEEMTAESGQSTKAVTGDAS